MLKFIKIVIFLQLSFWPEIKPDDTDGTEIGQDNQEKCVLPPPIENGKYSIINSNTGDFVEATPGDLVENAVNIIHECNTGYYSDSIPINTCLDGKWEERFRGCMRNINCDLPEFPQNGKYEIIGSSNTAITPGQQISEFTILTFSCTALYDLVDSPKLVCIDGEWTTEPPTCKRSTRCALPEPPTNGRYFVIGSNITGLAGETVEESRALYYSCDLGYILKDGKVMYCHNGVWFGGPVDCIGSSSTLDLTVYQDCSEVSGFSGVYNIKPNEEASSLAVYCELNLDGQKWTVIQQRVDGTVDFYRDYETYQHFFGDVQGNYWIGLENMYQITKDENQELFVELEDLEGRKTFARYNEFSVGSASTGYVLNILGYTGTAGDGMSRSNGQKFSTFDNNEDQRENVNCTEKLCQGAWWYNWCTDSNLNGNYSNTDMNGDCESMSWSALLSEPFSVKYTRMLVRNKENEDA